MIATNKEALQYYRITESSYKALDRNGTPFMNLGLWPSPSILDAQTGLVELVVSKLASLIDPADREKTSILELGSGWGGSRRVIFEKLPGAFYTGVNCSLEQITYSSNLNSQIANTRYIEGFFENLERLPLGYVNSLLAIESLLHVERKEEVLNDLPQLGIKRLVLAEICIEDQSLIKKYPLFNPSLKYTWSKKEYDEYFKSSSIWNYEIIDISRSVFDQWSASLSQIDSSDFSGNTRVLSQFKESYAQLAELSKKQQASYLIINASLEK